MYLTWLKWPYIFGEAFCLIRGLAAETSANATVLTITAFTVERYVAICHPLRSHKLSQLSRVITIILLIWVFALALALPQAAQFGVVDEVRIVVAITNSFSHFLLRIPTKFQTYGPRITHFFHTCPPFPLFYILSSVSQL